jgi:hypothetical protein
MCTYYIKSGHNFSQLLAKSVCQKSRGHTDTQGMLQLYSNSAHSDEIYKLPLLGPMLIKINTVSANFNNTRPSLILNN